jgi:hypothetical protein
MAGRRNVKLRRGLLLRQLVRSTCPTARRASVATTKVSKNRIHVSNASSLRQCPPVADEDPEYIRTTSMMDDCNARALTPLRKSSIAVLSARVSRPVRGEPGRVGRRRETRRTTRKVSCDRALESSRPSAFGPITRKVQIMSLLRKVHRPNMLRNGLRRVGVPRQQFEWTVPESARKESLVETRRT